MDIARKGADLGGGGHRTMAEAMRPFLWPLDRLGEALEELSRRSGLRKSLASEPLKVPPAIAAGATRNLADWFEWAAEHLGVEANLVQTPLSNIPALIRAGGPAVFRIDGFDIQHLEDGQTGLSKILYARQRPREVNQELARLNFVI